MKTYLSILATCAVILSSSARAQVYLPAITEGHGDIGAGYDGGVLGLELHLHGAAPDGSLDNHQTLGESILRYDFTGQSKSSLSSLSAYQVWKSPSTQTPGMPFLGLGAEEIPLGEFTGDKVSLAVTGFSFTGWTGLTSGGNFFLGQEDEFGNPSLLYNSTSTNIGSVDLPAGAHMHGEWAFTEAGIYDITFQLTGILASDSTQQTDTGTLRFEIIPEPSSGALLLAGLAALAVMRRRRA